MKTPGYNLMTGVIIKQLPEQTLIAITQLFDAVLKTGH